MPEGMIFVGGLGADADRGEGGDRRHYIDDAFERIREQCHGAGNAVGGVFDDQDGGCHNDVNCRKFGNAGRFDLDWVHSLRVPAVDRLSGTSAAASPVSPTIQVHAPEPTGFIHTQQGMDARRDDANLMPPVWGRRRFNSARDQLYEGEAMANFTTHIAVGTVVSGALATLTLAADVVAPQNLVAVTLAGVLGSVLPDIDLKDSRPSRAMFAGLAIFFSFAVLFHSATKYSVAELWILWLGTLLFVRYGLHKIFHKFSVHRGIWHSLLAAVFCAVMTAIVFRHMLGKPAGVSWLAGAFLFLGYVTHLTLDEMYSVDVMDTRLKASFGTALKVFDRRHIKASVAMAAATIGAILISPSTTTFVDGLASRSLWTGLEQRMLPSDKWFGVLRGPYLAKQQVSPDAGVVTGSVDKTPADIMQENAAPEAASAKDEVGSLDAAGVPAPAVTLPDASEGP